MKNFIVKKKKIKLTYFAISESCSRPSLFESKTWSCYKRYKNKKKEKKTIKQEKKKEKRINQNIWYIKIRLILKWKKICVIKIWTFKRRININHEIDLMYISSNLITLTIVSVYSINLSSETSFIFFASFNRSRRKF